MLKSLRLSLAQIKGVLESSNRAAILTMLFDEKEASLREELEEGQTLLNTIGSLKSELDLHGKLITQSTSSMAQIMEDKKAFRRWMTLMVVLGICVDVLWIGTLVYGIMTGIWWPFPVALAICIVVISLLVAHYHTHVTYHCPVCNAEFRPGVAAFFFSNHTPKTRKLRCPCCGEKDWCVEHYHAEKLTIAPNECVPGTCNRN